MGLNVLSIVVKADCRPWLSSGRGPLLAVVGETVVAGKPPGINLNKSNLKLQSTVYITYTLAAMACGYME